MSNKTNYASGIEAEEIAQNYLQKQKFKIIEQRYKTRYGEIDIIAAHKKMLVFVEVKKRQSKDQALYAITPRTQKRIEQTALMFLSENPEYTEYDLRFDVIAFDEAFQMTHLDNAWFAQA